jgi:hypothetical protein
VLGNFGLTLAGAIQSLVWLRKCCIEGFLRSGALVRIYLIEVGCFDGDIDMSLFVVNDKESTVVDRVGVSMS